MSEEIDTNAELTTQPAPEPVNTTEPIVDTTEPAPVAEVATSNGPQSVPAAGSPEPEEYGPAPEPKYGTPAS